MPTEDSETRLVDRKLPKSTFADGNLPDDDLAAGDFADTELTETDFRFELLPDETVESTLDMLYSAPVAPDPSGELDAAVSRSLSRALEFAAAQNQEAQAALRLMAELVRLPLEKMRRKLAERPPFRSPELCRLLIDESYQEAHNDPERAVELAILATEAAALDPSLLGERILHDLRAESWAAVATARRVCSDFSGAEEALRTAEEHLAEGSGTLMVRADVLTRVASLRRDQRRLPEASRLIAEVLHILKTGARPFEVARALVCKASLYLETGGYEEGARLLEESLRLLQGSPHQRLVMSTQHHLVLCLCGLGQLPQAAELQRETLTMATLLGCTRDRILLLWLGGRIARGEGRLADAEAAYLKVLHQLKSERLYFDIALLGLELAEIYAVQGRTGSRKKRKPAAVRPIRPVFEARRAISEGLVGLLLLRQGTLLPPAAAHDDESPEP